MYMAEEDGSLTLFQNDNDSPNNLDEATSTKVLLRSDSKKIVKSLNQSRDNVTVSTLNKEIKITLEK